MSESLDVNVLNAISRACYVEITVDSRTDRDALAKILVQSGKAFRVKEGWQTDISAAPDVWTFTIYKETPCLACKA